MELIQLELDALYSHLPHGHDGIVRLVDGFRGQCKCGYVSMEQPTRHSARVAVSSHIARTEPGARLVALLRRP